MLPDTVRSVRPADFTGPLPWLRRYRRQRVGPLRGHTATGHDPRRRDDEGGTSNGTRRRNGRDGRRRPGNDRYVVVRGPDNSTGVVWVHRWDTGTDADEFDSAMGTYLDQRREETDSLRSESQRLAPDATAVVVGLPGSWTRRTRRPEGTANERPALTRCQTVRPTVLAGSTTGCPLVAPSGCPALARRTVSRRLARPGESPRA